jgi:hypothetical protein
MPSSHLGFFLWNSLVKVHVNVFEAIFLTVPFSHTKSHAHSLFSPFFFFFCLFSSLFSKFFFSKNKNK